jgi:hypothetical protein
MRLSLEPAEISSAHAGFMREINGRVCRESCVFGDPVLRGFPVLRGLKFTQHAPEPVGMTVFRAPGLRPLNDFSFYFDEQPFLLEFPRLRRPRV